MRHPTAGWSQWCQWGVISAIGCHRLAVYFDDAMDPLLVLDQCGPSVEHFGTDVARVLEVEELEVLVRGHDVRRLRSRLGSRCSARRDRTDVRRKRSVEPEPEVAFGADDGVTQMTGAPQLQVLLHVFLLHMCGQMVVAFVAAFARPDRTGKRPAVRVGQLVSLQVVDVLEDSAAPVMFASVFPLQSYGLVVQWVQWWRSAVKVLVFVLEFDDLYVGDLSVRPFGGQYRNDGHLLTAPTARLGFAVLFGRPFERRPEEIHQRCPRLVVHWLGFGAIAAIFDTQLFGVFALVELFGQLSIPSRVM